jgi:hypothetical protein
VGNNPNPCLSEQSVVNAFGVGASLDDARAGMGAHKARPYKFSAFAFISRRFAVKNSPSDFRAFRVFRG